MWQQQQSSRGTNRKWLVEDRGKYREVTSHQKPLMHSSCVANTSSHLCQDDSYCNGGATVWVGVGGSKCLQGDNTGAVLADLDGGQGAIGA